MLRLAPLVLPLVLLAGCAAQERPAAEDPFTGWNKDFRTCRAEYAEIDAKVAAAGVGEAGYYRVPGYPYLRTDRTLASFAHEVKSLEEVAGWVRRMREADQEAREFEYINLGMSKQDAANQRYRFINCGRVLAGIEFIDEPKAFARLLELAQPEDEYSAARRLLGFHALTAPLMRARIDARAQALAAAYTVPVEALPTPAPLTLWKPQPEADLTLIPIQSKYSLPDELGYPGMTESQWRALAEHHAPLLWIETASDSDRLAAPQLTPAGATANPELPRANFYVTFARFGGKPLVQMQYLFWFKGADDSAPIDGFIWRVTFDADYQPLIYESVHTSGRDHRWYPVQPLKPRARNGDARGIPVIAPQAAPPLLPTVRIRAGTHEIVRVLDAGTVTAADTRTYEIRRYEDLFTLPAPGGGTRSLFGPDGLVRGPHADDPIGGFSSGIPKPGALRQLGHHPIAHVGRAHFDEPYLLESVFVPPEPQGS
jgi:hypothetical protein